MDKTHTKGVTFISYTASIRDLDRFFSVKWDPHGNIINTLIKTMKTLPGD